MYFMCIHSYFFEEWVKLKRVEKFVYFFKYYHNETKIFNQFVSVYAPLNNGNMKTQRLQHNYSSQQCCLLYVSHWQKASWLIQQIICVTATVAGHPFWSLGTSADSFLGFCSLLLFSHWPVWWGRWSGTWWYLSPCRTSEEQDRTWVAVCSVYRPGCSSWVDDPYVIRGLLHPQGVFAGVLDEANLHVVNLLLVVHDQDQRFAVGVDGAVPDQEGPVLSWPVHKDRISHAGVISLTW